MCDTEPRARAFEHPLKPHTGGDLPRVLVAGQPLPAEARVWDAFAEALQGARVQWGDRGAGVECVDERGLAGVCGDTLA
eukprot:108552-Chlamydomonas_euryale.AAC.1